MRINGHFGLDSMPPPYQEQRRLSLAGAQGYQPKSPSHPWTGSVACLIIFWRELSCRLGGASFDLITLEHGLALMESVGHSIHVCILVGLGP